MKGRFDFLILHLLSKEEMYGFQIIKRFAENCAEDEFELKTGTLYPLLAAMRIEVFCHREPLLCPAENASFTGQPNREKNICCSRRKDGISGKPLPTKYLNANL